MSPTSGNFYRISDCILIASSCIVQMWATSISGMTSIVSKPVIQTRGVFGVRQMTRSLELKTSTLQTPFAVNETPEIAPSRWRQLCKVTPPCTCTLNGSQIRDQTHGPMYRHLPDNNKHPRGRTRMQVPWPIGQTCSNLSWCTALQTASQCCRPPAVSNASPFLSFTS